MLYTDGITEARHGYEFFGMEGAERVLSQYGSKSPNELVDELLAAMNRWAEGRLKDDVAAVVMQRESSV